MEIGLVGGSVTGAYKNPFNENFECELMWFLWLKKELKRLFRAKDSMLCIIHKENIFFEFIQG